MSKLISVYLRKDTIIVDTMSKTTDGLWISSAPYRSCSATASNEEMGGLAKEALAASQQNIPHPTTWDNSTIQPLLEIAKVKSYSTFMKGTLHCLVKEDGNIIMCKATENMGAKRGFVEIDDAVVKISVTASNERLGKAIHEALSLSK